ncbi:hypothetical protein P9112_014720 [Eukaryota sp. TZLM1-RC]
MYVYLLSILALAFTTSCTLLFILSRFRKVKNSVAFFHPYANDAGGGERVLWFAVQALQKHDPKLKIYVYTGRSCGETPTSILTKAQSSFGVKLSPVNFIFIKSRTLLDPKLYPFFTLLFQSFASLLVGLECLLRFVPSYYIDTMGSAFTYPLFRVFGGSNVACYVHYPIITSEMVTRIKSRRQLYNNRNWVANSKLLTLIKILYYRLFSFFYLFVSKFTSVVMVNSTWTYNHITQLWNRDDVLIVYPPCDTRAMKRLPLAPRENVVVAVAQFRPEKNHFLMLDAWKFMMEKYGNKFSEKPVLELIGSVRPKDRAMVDSIKERIVELGLEDSVVVKENLAYIDLLARLQVAKAGLHAMTAEHFGISVVEYMASGAIPIAHCSGGPLSDIVIPLQDGSQTGFLCSDVEEYARALGTVLLGNWDHLSHIQHGARRAVKRFSQESFIKTFLMTLSTSRFFSRKKIE